MPDPTIVDSERTTLRELLHAASRTFAVGIDQLPGSQREAIQTAYLLLRVSDYLEDNESMPVARKTDLLSEWGQVLEGTVDPARLVEELAAVEDDTPDALVARRTHDVLQALRRLSGDQRAVVTRHVVHTTRGMARWVARGADFQTEADLDDYMHEVAGRVGHLLTELFALESPAIDDQRDEMMRLGREFGLGLQTVNVIRGLHEDRFRGWVYVPREFLPREHMDPAALFSPAHQDDALLVLDRLVRKAERHLRAAVEYTTRIPRRMKGVRVFCALPLFFAVRTLGVSRSNPDVLRREVKITRREVRAIMLRTQALASSNAWIRRYAASLGLER